MVTELPALPMFDPLVMRGGRVARPSVGFARFSANFSRKFAPLGFDRVKAGHLVAGLSSAIGLLALSCGTPGHAILVINAPSSVVAGSPFSATVTAMYEGRVDTAIDGPIHFTSSDPAAVLPTLYVFTAADAGVHTFTGLLLNTPGNQNMTVSDYDATPIAGTVNIMVTPATGDEESAQFKEEQKYE
jgi:hypothetical protein